MAVSVTIQGASLALALSALGIVDLSSVETDTLLQELRQRYVSQSPAMVVKVVPFNEKSLREVKGSRGNA